MVLLERVATLLHADVERLLERTERPREMLQQLVLDMENQLLQMKTQAVIALTDQRRLEEKAREQQQILRDFERVAGSAKSGDDPVTARLAAERVHRQERVVASYLGQMRDQQAEAGAWHETFLRLQAKMAQVRVSYAPLMDLG